MSTEQTAIEWATTIGWKLLDWGVPFVVGILFRKRVANLIISLKKLAFNDYIEVNLLAVREYLPSLAGEISPDVFRAIQPKIADIRLVDHNADSMIIGVPEFSPNLILTVERQSGTEDSEYDGKQKGRVTRMAVRTENPLAVGARDLVKKVSQFERDAEIIFETIEKMAFMEHKPMKNTYAICDLSRTGRFKEAKSFDIEDKRLHARVIASEDQLSITTSPIDKLSNAAEKYRFA